MKEDISTSSAVFKQNIRTIVAEYIKQFPYEYELVKQAIIMKRKLMADPKFGELEGSAEGGARAIYEIPETLSTALVMHLSPDATAWFKSVEGGRWFAKTFPEFALPTHI